MPGDSNRKTGFAYVVEEFYRLRWALLISIAILGAKAAGWLPPDHALAVVLTKASTVTIGFVLAHVLRKQVFPYIDLREMMETKNPAFGYAFVGISFLYGAIINAVALSL